MIEYASEKDISCIIALWHECFGDDEEYIRFFTDRHTDPCLLYKVNGKAVSMMFLLGGVVRISGEEYPAKYVYAACTAEKYRGRGYMGELIAFAFAEGKISGDSFVCLVPGEKSLFDYYSRFGFVTAFKKQIINAKRDKLNAFASGQSVSIGKPNFSRLISLRNLLCGDAFLWNEKALEYAFAENERCGGKNICLSDNTGYAIIRGEKIIEIFALPESVNPLIELILAVSSANTFEINTCCNSLALSSVQTVENAMLYPLNKFAEYAVKLMKNAYLGLTLE